MPTRGSTPTITTQAIRDAGSRWGRSKIRTMIANSTSVMRAKMGNEWWAAAIMGRLYPQ